jgi:hypothetical protein
LARPLEQLVVEARRLGLPLDAVQDALAAQWQALDAATCDGAPPDRTNSSNSPEP